MSDLIEMDFEGKGIRVYNINGEPYWVGKDVCDYFGDSNHKRSLSRLDEMDKTFMTIVDTHGRPNQAILINESGLFNLLWNFKPEMARNGGGSQNAPRHIERLEQIRKFKRWVTEDVLPSIRKTGSYGITPKSYIEALEAHLAAQKEKAAIEEENKILLLKNDDLTQQLIALKDKMSKIDPKAAAVYDLLINDGHISVQDSGRALDIGGIKTMNTALVNATVFKAKKSEFGIYEPYQIYMDKGYFTLCINPNTMAKEYHVTGQGILFLSTLNLKQFTKQKKLTQKDGAIKIESFILFNEEDITIIDNEGEEKDAENAPNDQRRK